MSQSLLMVVLVALATGCSLTSALDAPSDGRDSEQSEGKSVTVLNFARAETDMTNASRGRLPAVGASDFFPADGPSPAVE